MYDIEVSMRLANQGDVMAFGTVTIAGAIRFMVQMRKYITDRGEEKIFLRYPQRKTGDEWQDVIRPCRELKDEIQKNVVESIKRELVRDFRLPEIEDVRVETVEDAGNVQKKSVVTCGMASVLVSGLWIDGITIKRGTKGLFINMPQYRQPNGIYRDLIYAVTKKMQQDISDAVIGIYKEITAEKEKSI